MNLAFLILRMAGFGVAPAITGTSGAGSYTTGDSITVGVTVTGTAPLSYQWKKNGVTIGGATSASYSIGSSSTGDSATYTCVVTNSWGSVTSSGISVSVSDPPEPPSVTVTGGGTYPHATGTTLHASASGDGALSYQWFIGATLLTGETSTSLSVTGLNAGGPFVYTCEVTSPYGSDSDSASVTYT